MPLILTTKGELEESVLERTTIFEDRPTKFVVAVEYRFQGELVRRDLFMPPDKIVDETVPKGHVYTTLGVVEESILQRKVVFEECKDEFSIAVEYRYGGDIVKRDAHVLLKQVPPAVASEVGGF